MSVIGVCFTLSVWRCMEERERMKQEELGVHCSTGSDRLLIRSPSSTSHLPTANPSSSLLFPPVHHTKRQEARTHSSRNKNYEGGAVLTSTTYAQTRVTTGRSKSPARDPDAYPQFPVHSLRPRPWQWKGLHRFGCGRVTLSATMPLGLEDLIVGLAFPCFCWPHLFACAEAKEE